MNVRQTLHRTTCLRMKRFHEEFLFGVKPLTSDLAFVAQTETCEADLGSSRSSVLRARHCARRL